jgi:16S rRNA (guanine527-N7)-methyltransferase
MSGDADSQATGLVGVLSRSRDLGFLGPGPLDQQLEHSRVFGNLVQGFLDEPPARFLDLGAGGGLPGLVLLDLWPQSTGVLVDAQEKRCRFLLDAIASLGWESRAEVRCGRAEVLARQPDLRGRFGLVVARGFGPPAVTAECAVGFLSPSAAPTAAPSAAPSAVLAVTEPPVAVGIPGSDARWPAESVRELGFLPATVLRAEHAGAACLRLPTDPDHRWPRRDGVPGKRPLW